jgi:formyl-CoA transferase
MPLPCSGVRVVDLTSVISGPFCTYQLALMGADVIKVEQPGGGDSARAWGAGAELNERQMGSMFLAQNAGKRSIALNLKAPAAVAVFRKLAATADVVVENFRPGVMSRLGVGPEELRAAHPRLIYCAISGFGQTGPYRDNPAYDQIVQGLSGAMSTTGDPAGPPYRAGYPIGDTAGGMAAAFAIAAALLERERTGAGQAIDVSLLDTLLAMTAWAASNFLIDGQAPRRMGNDNATSSPSGAFHTADGFINIAANAPNQFQDLCGALGRPELVTDPRFCDRAGRLANRAALKAELERVLATRSAAEWERTLNEAGVPAGRVLTVPEALSHPHVRARNLVRRFDNAAGVTRPIDVLTSGYRLSGGAPEVTLPPPGLGEHTDAILGELGYSAPEIGALRKAAATG